MLIDCIKQAGDNLDEFDREFLLDELSNGATDEMALNKLAAAIRAELNDIAARVEEQGGTVSRETPFLAQRRGPEQPPKAERLDSGPTGDFRISTRVPTSNDSIEHPIVDNLTVDTSTLFADPDHMKKLADLIRGYDAYRPTASADSDEKVIRRFMRQIEDNLLWLYDQVPEDIRERSHLWYDGARVVVDNWSERYGVEPQVVAGVLAALSPQKDWFMNQTQAERILDIYLSEQDTVTMQEMQGWIDQQIAEAEAKHEEKAGEELEHITLARRQKIEWLQDLAGKKLSDLEFNTQKAMWVRAFDETHNSKNYRIGLPEGGFADTVMTDEGEAARHGWGSFNEIAKAISVIDDPSIANISRQMGGAHKVRNFYNNIVAPKAEHGDVTMDTHAVAAALLMPLSGDSPEVTHNLSGPSKALTGLTGLYAIYADAYRSAAKARGILPREMQSITWEAIRGLFTAGYKAQDANVAAVRAIWQRYRNGNLSRQAAIDAILEHKMQWANREGQAVDKPIEDPFWHDGPNSARPGESRTSSYERNLPDDSVRVGGTLEGIRDRAALVRSRQQAEGRASIRSLLFDDSGTDRPQSKPFRRVSKKPTEVPRLKGVTGVRWSIKKEYRDGAYADADATPLDYYEITDGTAFRRAILGSLKNNPYAAAVEVKPLKDYKSGKYRMFIAPGGEAGFAIDADGDLVSVFKYGDAPIDDVVSSVLPLAIQQGATKLDAFDTILPKLYSRYGFKVVSRVGWNDEYAPDGWDYELFKEYNNGRPDVVLMVLDPDSGAYERGEGELFTDWGDAAAARDSYGQPQQLNGERDAIQNERNASDQYLTQQDTRGAGGDRQDGRRTLGPRGQSHKARGLPVREDGLVPLTHWSTTGGLTSLDPDFHGTGATGAEKARSGRLGRTYYGAPGYKYLRDPGVASVARNPYFVAVDAERLYDFRLDPDGIHSRLKAEAAANTQYGQPYVDPNDVEQAIKDAGYLGYFVINPQFGPIIASFEALDVAPLQAGTREPVWDESGATEYLAETGTEGTERGRYYPSKQTIQLTADSDLSSFLHEASHYFLEMERYFAQQYGVTENQQAILDWLGIESFDELDPTTERGRELHERWAETFEVYLREGKAPSLKLRRAFAAFSRWLKKIYRVLTGDPRLDRAKLDEEITGIFDRLLATEEEIAEAAANPAYDQFFQSQEQAGMTDAEWRDYQAQAEKVKEDAEMALDEKVIAQYVRMRTREWVEERQVLEAEEMERLQEEPIYQRIEALKESPLDRAKLKALIPGQSIPRSLYGASVKEGGVDPQLMAEQLGYDSAQEMVDEMLLAPPIKKAAQDAAQARMVEKYGDILNDGTLEEEVREAITNEAQAKLLQMELNAINKARRAPGINREYLKAQAEKMIAGMKYSDIKPNKYYQAMVRATTRAARAEPGSAEQAEAKVQQLVNHYLYREALKTREQMTKHRRYVRGVQQRAVDTKKVDATFAQNIKLLANMYDMRDKDAQRVTLDQILSFYQGQFGDLNTEDAIVQLQLLDPNLVRALRYKQEHGGNLTGFELMHFDDMTAEDLRGLVDMLKHMRFVGGQVATAARDEVARERQGLIQSTASNGGKDYGSPRGKETPGAKSKRFISGLFNGLPSLGNMIRKLDGGKDGGPWFQSVYQLIVEANNRKLELTRKAFDDLNDQVGDLYKVGLSGMDAKKYTTLSGAEVSLTSEQTFMLAVYWGTESSREAIMENVQGVQITEQDALNLMARLTPAQLEMVNAIWSFNESMWPDLRDAGIAMDGVAPPKLDPTPFYVNGVYMTGGHMQLMYDSTKAEQLLEQDAGRNLNEVMPTKAGSLNARRGSDGMPVALSLNNVARSISDKVHYIAFARTARKIRQLVVPKDVAAMIEKKHGPAFYRAFVQAIGAITAPRVPQETQREVAKMSRHVRSAMSLQVLGYSFRNVVQQFGAYPIALAEVGPMRLAQAISHVYAHYDRVTAEIHAKSKFMENRTQMATREIREATNRMVSKNMPQKVWNVVRSYAFSMQTLVDRFIAYPTWWATYSRSMEEHGDEKRARTEADDAVGRSVGSGADIHLGTFLQSNQSEFVKTLGVFNSWFNNYYQRLYRSSNGFEDLGNAKFAMDALMLPVVVGTLSQLLVGDTPDEDEDWWEYVTKNGALFLLGTVPILREIATYSAGFTPAQPISQIPGAAARAFNEAEAVIEGRQGAVKTAADFGRVTTPFVPLPGGGNLWRALDYTDSYLQGKEGPDFNPVEALVEGRERDK